MATVVSLTETKIKELLSGWEGVSLSQDEINILVQQLLESQAAVDAAMLAIKEVTIPGIQTELAANDVKLAELNDTTLPGLNATLDQTRLELANVKDVEIPALQTNLAAEIQSTIERPKVFVQNEPPPPYDDLEERDLVVGDTWYDSDDNNRQRIWNGVEWSTFNVDIPDLSLTVKKFKTSTHMLY